jgi:hypothetical protein
LFPNPFKINVKHNLHNAIRELSFYAQIHLCGDVKEIIIEVRFNCTKPPTNPTMYVPSNQPSTNSTMYLQTNHPTNPNRPSTPTPSKKKSQ